METLILPPIPTATEKPTALGFLSSLLFKSEGGEIQAEEQASNHNPRRIEAKLTNPPVMAEVNSTEHVDLERNSNELTMAAGDAQGNSTTKHAVLELSEDGAAAAAAAAAAAYGRKRDDRKARIINELGEKAYVEADDDYLTNDDDNVDEINECTGIQGEREQASLTRAKLANSGSNFDQEEEEEEEAEEEEEEELEAEEFISLMEGRAAAAEAALDELLARKKSKGGDVKQKARMADGDVNFILSLKRKELGGMEHLDSMSHHYTPERMEEKRRLHEEIVVICHKIDDEIEERQAQIIKDLSEKGYAEADENYLADDEEFNKLERIYWESLMAASERRMGERRRMRVAAARKEEVEGFTVRPHHLGP